MSTEEEARTGWLSAIDVESGEVKWRYHSPTPMVSGVTTTAGGLVISGELTGNLLLMDASSGNILHSVNTGAPVGGGIVTYEVEGRQYIATNSGNAMLTFRTGTESQRTGSIIVYALPDD